MSLHLFRILFRDGRVLALSAALAAITGCHKEEIASYEAPKEQPLPASGSPHAGHGAPDASQNPMAGAPRPGLRWRTLPEGWTSNGPSGMRVATFTIASSSGATADLGVIPLPGTGGSDLDLVNLWRSQLGLPPITEPELTSHTDETSIGGQAVKLFSIVGSGSADANATANQILVAALRREGSTWFFKLGGPAEIVAANREALKSFLGAVEFTAPETSESASAPATAAAPAAESSSGPNAAWEIPDTWKAVPAPRMVHSKWTTTSEKGGGADVTVSVFPGEAGGLLPNLNRWRSQVGLGQAPDTELSPLIGNLEITGGQGTLVDFQGQSPESGDAMRLVGAVVKKDGNSWYYKILGTPAAVEAQRAAFIKFIQTARYTRG
ncbi:MAG: hypothetical protein IT581_13745 [Verrucomicrobiales bacterium]|nr:hypothetical protein [Verrucomicrobiales bacterium]